MFSLNFSRCTNNDIALPRYKRVNMNRDTFQTMEDFVTHSVHHICTLLFVFVRFKQKNRVFKTFSLTYAHHLISLSTGKRLNN